MDLLPPELIAQLCSLACTDDGTTTRSLFAVSCAFHDTVEEKLYDTVSLEIHSSRDIRKINMLVDRIQFHKAQVRSLWISIHIPLEIIIPSIFPLLTIARPTLENLALISVTPLSLPMLNHLLYPSTPWLKLHSLLLSSSKSAPPEIDETKQFPPINEHDFPSLQSLHLHLSSQSLYPFFPTHLYNTLHLLGETPEQLWSLIFFSMLECQMEEDEEEELHLEIVLSGNIHLVETRRNLEEVCEIMSTEYDGMVTLREDRRVSTIEGIKNIWLEVCLKDYID